MSDKPEPKPNNNSFDQDEHTFRICKMISGKYLSDDELRQVIEESKATLELLKHTTN